MGLSNCVRYNFRFTMTKTILTTYILIFAKHFITVLIYHILFLDMLPDDDEEEEEGEFKRMSEVIFTSHAILMTNI